MTYFNVLGLYVAPAVILAALAARQARWPGLSPHIAILALVAVALAYTTPWDNYLVATGVWWYDEALVMGWTIGWVPVEEYAFFILQTLLTGFWTLGLARRLGAPGLFAAPGPKGLAGAAPGAGATVRLPAAAAAGLGWLLAVGLWLSGWRPGTYLGLILTWGLAPIVIQLAYGADILYIQRRLLCGAIAAPTLYLWLVDGLAMRSGTWVLDPAQTLGVVLGGVLPVEEMVFFLITNVLIGFGVVLLLADASQQRARALLARRHSSRCRF